MSRRVPDPKLLCPSAMLAAVALAALGCAPPPVSETREQPSVLLLLVDDLRPDLRSFGHSQMVTPAIDRLAESGIRFARAYSQYPACNPSRASLLTGLRPDTTGILDNETPLASRRPDVVTLPRLFREHGYFTAAIGKVFHGAGRRDDWKVSGAWDVELFPRVGRRVARPEGPPGTRGRVGRYSWRMEFGDDNVLQDTKVAKRAVEVLEEVGERPFFIAVGLAATHPHFVAPARFFELYPTASIEPPAGDTEMAALLARLQGWSDEEAEAFSRQQKQELIRAYRACVSFVDEQVGRMMEALDRLALAERTIVVLVSDHGYHLGEQGWWSKRTLYEASTRVPWIMRIPGDEGVAGRYSDRPVEMIDLFPTLAELAGLEPPTGIEGTSLVPLIEDPQREWPRGAYSQVDLGQVVGRSVRLGTLRYTEWRGATEVVELFDYTDVASESSNLADDPGYAEARQRLTALLEERWER